MFKKPKKSGELPEGIKPPPAIVKLPNPDGLEEPNQQTRVNKEKKKKPKKKKRDRTHPKDPYAPVRHVGRGCGCGTLCLLFLLLLSGVVAVLGWQLKREFVAERGFDWIKVNGRNLATAPEKETVYLGAKVFYEAPETNSEVVFAGGIWWLKGTFHEKVYFRGLQLNLEPDARFLKGLHVDAVFFDAGEAEILGPLTGRITKQE